MAPCVLGSFMTTGMDPRGGEAGRKDARERAPKGFPCGRLPLGYKGRAPERLKDHGVSVAGIEAGEWL